MVDLGMPRMEIPADWRTRPERAAVARQYGLALERGEILYFPLTPLVFAPGELDFLRSQKQSAAQYHKNIAYRPATDRITGYAGEESERMHRVLGGFSRAAQRFLKEFFPYYRFETEYASFRPLAEESRKLKPHARNDLLHIDNFPTRPTGGSRILRFFINLHATRPRHWRTGPAFPALAREYASGSGLIERTRAQEPWQKWLRLAARLGLAGVSRPAYDRFMLSFHHWLKDNAAFQALPGHEEWDFPPLSAWMVYTDTVSHAVLGGQYALEQTMLVRRESLLAPEIAPVTIVEQLLATSATA